MSCDTQDSRSSKTLFEIWHEMTQNKSYKWKSICTVRGDPFPPYYASELTACNKKTTTMPTRPPPVFLDARDWAALMRLLLWTLWAFWTPLAYIWSWRVILNDISIGGAGEYQKTMHHLTTWAYNIFDIPAERSTWKYIAICVVLTITDLRHAGMVAPATTEHVSQTVFEISYWVRLWT
jgi:hypothetical protein